MVRPVRSHSAIWYIQMGWDGRVGLLGNCWTVGYVPWDTTVPYSTNGMVWTGRITRLL